MSDWRAFDPQPPRGPESAESPPRGRYREVPPQGQRESSRPGYEPTTGAWDVDEGTKMIGKLGYVPREARGEPDVDPFDTERVTRADRQRYRTRKRARKTSPWAILGIAALALVVLGGLGAGGWYLFSGEDDDQAEGPKYGTVDEACAALDQAAVSELAGGAEVEVLTDAVDDRDTKSELTCEVTAAEAGVNVRVYAEVFERPTRAPRALEGAVEDLEGVELEPVAVDGVGEEAYGAERIIDEGPVDYRLGLYDGNAYLMVAVNDYGEDPSVEAAQQAAVDLATTYLENWAG